VTRLGLPRTPGAPTLSLPDGALTRDDKHQLLTGFRTWGAGERIRARLLATAPTATFEAGYSLAQMGLRSTDVAAGFRVDATGQMATGDTLARVTAVMVALEAGAAPAPLPAGLSWLERDGPLAVIVRLGRRDASLQRGVDYSVTLTLRSSGGADWQCAVPLMRCRA
jgi:hypothetical protein